MNLQKPKLCYLPAPPADQVNIGDVNPHVHGHEAPITEPPNNDGNADDKVVALGYGDDDDDDTGTVNSENTGVGSMDRTGTEVTDDPSVNMQPNTEAEDFQAAIESGHAQGLSDQPATQL